MFPLHMSIQELTVYKICPKFQCYLLSQLSPASIQASAVYPTYIGHTYQPF